VDIGKSRKKIHSDGVVLGSGYTQEYTTTRR
jgi:hypothetical protein